MPQPAKLLIRLTWTTMLAATVIVAVTAWQESRDWRQDRERLAALQQTIVELEGKVRFPRDLAPKHHTLDQSTDPDNAYALDQWLHRRVAPVPQLAPLPCKLALAKACQKMQMRLTAADVAIAPELQFGFERWTLGDDLPDADEVQLLLRRLELVDELTYQVAHAQLDSLTGIDYLGEKHPNGDLVMGFRLRGTGSADALRACLELVDRANYVFVVRSVDWQAQADGTLELDLVVHYLELRPEPWRVLHENLTVLGDKHSRPSLSASAASQKQNVLPW